MRSLRVVALVLSLSACWLAAPVQAEPVLLRPGDVLRATFDLRLFDEATAATFDVFEFIPGTTVVEPIGSFTTRLFNGEQILGTYVNPNPPGGALVSGFVAPTSPYTRGNPTVVDFTSFQDGSIDGVVEFSIPAGLLSIYRASDELNVGQSLGPETGPFYGFAPLTFEILRSPQPAPVPEPATVLLLASGVGYLGRRASKRRCTRGQRLLEPEP